jgi:light-regulated signal transduction histidine kinase (bacteriophytochrome)
MTPQQIQALALCAWVRRHDSDRPYSTSALSRAYPPALEFTDSASGLLAIMAGGEEPLEILWLRPEYPETIAWAGKPYKDGVDGHVPSPLTPRNSFEVWHEAVKGKAQPWTDAEISAAERLRDGIERIRERQRLNLLQANVIHMSRVNAMGAMASAIAHELNQPLTIIRNYATGLLRMIEGKSEADPEVTNILARISDQSLRAGEIIRHLRRLVSKEAAVMTPTPLHEVVDSACSIALLDAGSAGVTSRIAVASDLKVLADSVQVQQVIMNLVRNALDAMAGLEGSRERRLKITAMRVPDGFVQLTVWDSGNGLAGEIREKLFSTFNSGKKEGLGIGLSICRTIVEAHGGRIWLDEPAHGGTAFSLTLQEAPGA